MANVTALPPLSEDKPLPPEYRPNIDHLVTEDDEPVDNLYSEKQQRLLTEPLYASWVPGESFLAAANVGLFYGVHEPPIVPDVLLAKGVKAPQDLWPKQNRSYLVWEYGKAPDAVVEIVSNLEGGEATTKKQIYARAGVPYYVIWDPENLLGKGRLQVLGLQQRSYQPLAGNWLPSVQIGVTIWRGVLEDVEAEWLRWCDADGNLVPTGAERADKSERRAEKLAEQLRALGVMPSED